jgi:hypothetical protein
MREPKPTKLKLRELKWKFWERSIPEMIERPNERVNKESTEEIGQ